MQPVRSRVRTLAALALGLLAGCQATREIADDAAYEVNPFGSTDLSVYGVEVHGPYLLAEIEGRRERLRVLAPADARCGALLQPEARVQFLKAGVFGRVAGATEQCDLTGIASLEAWRDRRPHRRAGALVPRSSARFALLHEDGQVLLVRGRFALASRVGIPAAYDLVALLPNDAICRAAVARGAASLEFRPAGREPYRLLVDDAACVVAGFATPPAGR